MAETDKNSQNEVFNISMIDKTFTNYKKGQMFDGVVVLEYENGYIFNIGGKNDAFLPFSEINEGEKVKIGDRFKVVITNYKNAEDMIEVSKSLADNKILETQNANKLKLGSKFSFVVTRGEKDGIYSKMGDYSIFVPAEEISHKTRDIFKTSGKQFDAVVTEIDKDKKQIVASIKLLEDKIKETTENLFWNSIFINKIVSGTVKKIMPYGAFVDVDGVDCFVHISNLSYGKISNPGDVVKEGEIYKFKVILVDRENKKVALSKKALEDNPKLTAIKQLQLNEIYEGTVVKILAFGAIIRLDNGASGLLHIKNATDRNDKQIYEIVKLEQKVNVEVVDIDLDNERVSFKLIK